MSRKSNGLVVVFLIIFLAFGGFIVYQRINGSSDYNTDNIKESEFEYLDIESPLVTQLYKKVDLGKTLIEKFYIDNNTSEMGNDIKLLIVSGNLNENNLIAGTPIKNENTGTLERTYLLNSSVVKEKYEEIFGNSYTASNFIAHDNLKNLSFKYDDQTKMYYCDNGCISKQTNDGKIYQTKITEAIKENGNIILYQAVVYIINNNNMITVNDINGNQISQLKDEKNFTFTNDIIKKASIYQITFNKKDDKYYLNSIIKEK